MSTVALPAGLSRLAARQHGVLAGSQILGAGLTRRQLRYRVERLLLIPVVGDTYRVAGVPVTNSLRCMAATLAVSGSVLHDAAAAHIYGFPGTKCRQPEVVVARANVHPVQGIAVHRTAFLPARHRTTVDGIPATTIPRTVVDRAGSLHRHQLSNPLDALITRRRTTVQDVWDAFDEVAQRGRPGITTLRRLLVPRLMGLVVPESELEARGLDFLRSRTFAEPVLQFRPAWGSHAVARVDIAYLEPKVILEFDGRMWHDSDHQFEVDRVRDQIANMHGWLVVRITWRQLTVEPAATEHRLRGILAHRNAPHL
jgi:very-short-patch-repair endonuclease